MAVTLLPGYPGLTAITSSLCNMLETTDGEGESGSRYGPAPPLKGEGGAGAYQV